MAIEFNGVRWTQPEVDFMTDLFTPDDRVKVKALIKSIMGPGRFTEDTNKKCARLLNLCSNQDSSKYPDLVPCYDSVHGKLPRIHEFTCHVALLYISTSHNKPFVMLFMQRGYSNTQISTSRGCFSTRNKLKRFRGH